MSVTSPKPISNPAFFARRPIQSAPKVVLRSAPGARNKALTPVTQTLTGQRGFTYLGLMIIVAIMGAGLAAFGTIYSQTAQRDKEAELLFVGEQFRAAIGSYYLKSRVYPKKLDDLVEDKRFPMPVRHLRRIYADPMTGKADWGIVEFPGGGGIMGVYSLSEEKPIKTGNFSTKQAAFEDAENYTKWTFTYSPPGSGSNVPQAPTR
ncbi:MAG TPA: type II secretion system protein [Burkholderiales bacterium]|nr:type II secretion system protein [Burkholderiales bacterium]